MGDAEKVLEAVSGGPLPVHVVRQRTGIGTEISGTLAELQSQGKIVRAGEMVGLPEPGYIPNGPAAPEPVETGEWDVVAGDGSEDATMVMGPDVPVGEDVVDPEVQEQFMVATAYQLVTAISAQAAADQALGGQGPTPGKDEVLVVPLAEAQVYERATVVRPKRP